MPVFSRPRSFVIHGSHFTDVTHYSSGPTGIDVLLEASYPDAAHDAACREYAPRCFPGTREQYIQDTVNWGVSTPGCASPPLYWMRGEAGVGKSAIAQTCAEELKRRKKLGAAFFFSAKDRDNPQGFFPSIAYQLSTIHPPYRRLLDDKLRRDKTLVNKIMRSQFWYLIEEPLRELASQEEGIGERIVIIVDGLDECKGTDAQREIIRIIARAASDRTFPLCWAFFSRPESHLKATFSESTVAPHCHKFVPLFSRDANGQMELYLTNEFEAIMKRHKLTLVEDEWPSTPNMKLLVGAARGSYDYAKTVIRYVDCPGGISIPEQRLREIINDILDCRRRVPQAGTSFPELDALYKLVLKRIPADIFPCVELLLALICRRGNLGARLTANILGISKATLEIACASINAVLCRENETTFDASIDASYANAGMSEHSLKKLNDSVQWRSLGGQISFHHTSFCEFLLDPVRSGSYSVKESQALVSHCLKMHLNYDRSYCWEGPKLVSAPNAANSASSLSWPYKNELINSIVKASAYIEFGREHSESFSSPGVFEAMDIKYDFRKRLYVTTRVPRGFSSQPASDYIWGCGCCSKAYPGTSILWASLVNFDVNKFKLMVKQRKQLGIVQRYYPSMSARIGVLFSKTPWRFESKLYRLGRGERSIFWYWEINYKLEYYREFRTINLAEGEKRFREEDFASWPRPKI